MKRVFKGWTYNDTPYDLGFYWKQANWTDKPCKYLQAQSSTIFQNKGTKKEWDNEWPPVKVKITIEWED